MTVPDDRATEPSAEALTLAADYPFGYRDLARRIDAFAAQARNQALSEVRQIIDDVNNPPLTDPPNWSNACTAIDNRVRLLAEKPRA